MPAQRNCSHCGSGMRQAMCMASVQSMWTRTLRGEVWGESWWWRWWRKLKVTVPSLLDFVRSFLFICNNELLTWELEICYYHAYDLQRLDGTLMDSSWDDYDKLSVVFTSLGMLRAQGIVLWASRKWAFKHSLTCHECSCGLLWVLHC